MGRVTPSLSLVALIWSESRLSFLTFGKYVSKRRHRHTYSADLFFCAEVLPKHDAFI